MHIFANYKSGWLMVVFPGLVFLVTIFMVPYIVYMRLEYQGIGGIALVIVGGLALSMFLTWVTFPVFKKIASLKKVSISLEHNVISWDAKGGTHQIDLNKPYNAYVYCGKSVEGSGTNVIVRQNGNTISEINIAMSGFEPNAAALFKDSFFARPYALLPSEGMYGFDLEKESTEHVAFFEELLKQLWEYKDVNEVYKIHAQFPWNYAPVLKETTTVQLSTKHSDENKRIQEIKKHAVVVYDAMVYLTTDYVLIPVPMTIGDVAQAIFSPKDISDTYNLFPLGHVEVQRSTKLDAYMPGKYTPKSFIEFYGIDNNGNQVKTTIAEPVADFTDRDYLILDTLVHFLQTDHL